MSTRALTTSAGVTIRHVYPDPAGAHSLLGLTLAARWLPDLTIPHSSVLAEGSYTLRLDDAGEFSLTFPNAVAADGIHWRDRFSPELGRDWVEIYRDDRLDFVGQVQRVERDRGQITVSGTDAWGLLRKAYERDRTWAAAPQEVATAYTRVPVAVIADDFLGNSLAGGWDDMPSGHVTTGVSGSQVTITVANASTARQGLEYALDHVLGDTWRLTVHLTAQGTAPFAAVTLRTPTDDYVIEATGSASNAEVLTRTDALTGSPVCAASGAGRFPLPRTLVVERRGRWVCSYLNGVLTGFVEFQSAEGVDRVRIENRGSIGQTLIVDSVTLIEYQPLLSRGTDQGSYVLPGDYPPGGLRGRYFNDADLMSATGRHTRFLAPDRTPYVERLDPVINTSGGLSLPPQPGASGDHFSVRWSGAVYLRGDLGDYPFELTSTDDGVRLWVGRTAFPDALIDAWDLAAGTQTATWDASDHGAEAGWYPIVIEYFEDTGSAAIRLQFTPPASYTDPGGTALTGSSKVTVPSTSLSPLGCFDNRIQGQSHFDVVQQAAAQFGYQQRVEPMSLESGEFPGRLVPRVRVGRDTDVILEVDDSDRHTPILAPGVTVDGADQVLTLIGAGAGIADGGGAQVTVEITDMTGLAGALFAMEGTVDAGDIAFPSLLQARLDAELALRRPPWEEVRGTPLAQDQLADSWPLTAALLAMRWQPGDGVRLRIPDIGVDDLQPRPLLQVTRTITPLGVTGTQVGFRQRPRTASAWLRGNLKAAMSARRNYQGQIVTLLGELISGSVSASSFSGYSRMPLLPTDQVIRAYVRIVGNSAGHDLALEVNGNDQTSGLGGPWSVVPVEIDLRRYATQASTSDNRLYVRLQNTEGSSTTVEAQLVVEVLR